MKVLFCIWSDTESAFVVFKSVSSLMQIIDLFSDVKGNHSDVLTVLTEQQIMLRNSYDRMAVKSKKRLLIICLAIC